MNGAQTAAMVAAIEWPDMICTRLQPNSRSNGSMNRPLEYEMIDAIAMPAHAARTTVQFARHSAAALPSILVDTDILPKIVRY